jgi:penicillin-binding protein 1A
LLRGERQGASTIEQQFVRTVTQRYEKTPRRKVREQILAVMLNSRFSKDEISASYLAVAYYGVSLVGLRGLRILKVDVKEYVDEAIVAHLKYPRTTNRKSHMAHKHTVRVRHIRSLLSARKERLRWFFK